MRDYAELIKQTRESLSEVADCMGCCVGWSIRENKCLLDHCADAIEELLAERDQYKAYFDNVSSLPDCNVCLKQSVCEFVPAWGENTRINCPLALTEPPKEVE